MPESEAPDASKVLAILEQRIEAAERFIAALGGLLIEKGTITEADFENMRRKGVADTLPPCQPEDIPASE